MQSKIEKREKTESGDPGAKGGKKKIKEQEVRQGLL